MVKDPQTLTYATDNSDGIVFVQLGHTASVRNIRPHNAAVVDGAFARIRFPDVSPGTRVTFDARSIGPLLRFAQGHVPAVAHRAAVRYIEQVDTGAGRQVYIPQCRLHPTGATALKSRRDLQSFDFDARVSSRESPAIIITGEKP